MNIAIAIFSILLLVVLHELGHFLFAKRFGVKVEEFGIGIPPRLIGKKIGETIYSLNALPIGAFVRMEGEEKRALSSTSFSAKPIWQRMVIVGAGVAAFWIIAVLLFTFLGATKGIPMAVDDNTSDVVNPRVQILAVTSKSPADEARLMPGDILKNFTKVSDVREFTTLHKGEIVSLTIQRGGKILEVALTPRVEVSEGEGRLGVVLARSALVQYPWYKAPIEGVIITGKITWQIVEGLFHVVLSLTQKHALPQGAQVTGPIGIVLMLQDALSIGWPSFLAFVATLSVYLAVFNILPIPAADGGRLVFLIVEFFRKKPLAEHIEQKIIATSFGLLLIFFVYVTFKDIIRLF